MHVGYVFKTVLVSLSLVAGITSCLEGQESAGMSGERAAQIAEAVQGVLRETGTPSAQVGVIEHGKVVYTGAFGAAQLEPRVPATTAMVYGIGSVSKQFTAAAVMVLVEQGKIRLDDPVATWFPDIAHGQEITLRELLNQVSGYEDYYTEDYLTLDLVKPVETYAFVKRWTDHPLNFVPGTKWQYSNTNYLLAALIVQKVAKQPFFEFLQQNVLKPAGLSHVVNLDGDEVPTVPRGYFKFGFGPLRETPREAKGTLTGAGQLAMPIGELMRWDSVVMHRNAVLKPASWQVLQAEFDLPDGTGTGYGMGFFLEARKNRRVIEHSGGLNGFTTLNQIYPDDDAAIAVLINGGGGTGKLLAAVEGVLFAKAEEVAVKQDSASTALVRTALEQLALGKIDRSLLAPNLDFFFTAQALSDYKTSLAPFGPIANIALLDTSERGGMTGLSFAVTDTAKKSYGVSAYVTKAGKLDQLLLERAPDPE